MLLSQWEAGWFLWWMSSSVSQPFADVMAKLLENRHPVTHVHPLHYSPQNWSQLPSVGLIYPVMWLHSESQLSSATSCAPLSAGGFSPLGLSEMSLHARLVICFYKYIYLFWRSLFKCCGEDEPWGVGGRGHLRDELLCGHRQPGGGGLLGAHPVTGEPAEQREDHHDAEPRQCPAARRRHRPQQEVLHLEIQAPPPFFFFRNTVSQGNVYIHHPKKCLHEHLKFIEAQWQLYMWLFKVVADC